MNFFMRIIFWTVTIIGLSCVWLVFYILSFIKPSWLIYIYYLQGQVLRLSIACANIKLENMPIIHPEKKYLFTANHQSFDDTIIMNALLAKHGIYPRVMLKEYLSYIPFLTTVAKYMGYIFIGDNVRTNIKRMQIACDQHTECNGWGLFPEGHRADKGSLLKPHTAGVKWIIKNFPDHLWLDYTIIYTSKEIRVITTVMPQTNSSQEVEKALFALWKEKESYGLRPIDEQQ